jgi:hypothetical protein
VLDHRKPSTNIEVRITEIVVQIPIEHTSIRTVIPITADELKRTHENCTTQPLKTLYSHWGKTPIETPLRAIRKPSTKTEVRITEIVAQNPIEQTSKRTVTPTTADECCSISRVLIIIISKE